MSNQFLKLRRSSVPGKIPTTSSLEFGEIALNTYDGLAFIKKSGSNGEEIITIGATSGSFTGSLFGTASWAEQALTSSYSLNIDGQQYYVAFFDTQNSITSSTIFQSGSFTSIRNATTPVDPTNPDILLVDGTGVDTYNLISAHADRNNYVQTNVQNFNNSTIASSDVVASADNATESTNYIDMGINSSGYDISVGIVGGANDAYLYSTGNDLLIGNASANKRVVIFNGGLDTQTNARVYVHEQGTVSINTSTYNVTSPPALEVQAVSGNTTKLINAAGNVDDFLETTIVNANAGTSASADFVAYNDIDPGNQESGYVNMGINSTNYLRAIDFPGAAGDAYVFTDSDHLILGAISASAASKITLFAGGINEADNAKLILLGNNQHQMTGSLTATQGFTGSLYGTASWALNAITASSADNFVVRGSITGSDALFTGTITAQRLNVQYITASTEFVTGSSKFGSQLTDTHQFTGSVSVTGSLTVTGPLNATSSWASNALTASYVPASAIVGNVSRIATGSVTASVDVGAGAFQLVSGPSTFLYVNNSGSVGIGSTALTSNNLRVSRTITGSATPASIYTNSTIQADAGTATYYLTDANTVNTNFALSNLYHYQARQGSLLNVSAGGSVFSQIGFFVDSTLTGASNNYGFYGQVPSGAARWNLYMQGGASNYLSGSLGIGNTSLTGFGLRLSKPLTDAVGAYGIVADGQIQSDVVAQAYYYLSQASTQAASFTLTNLAHYVADQSTFGAGSTVSVQYGFRVRPTLIGATSNNYGFYGEIPFGSGRWNLYMQGGATNFLSGSLLIGTNTDAGFKLDVSGSSRITNGLQVTGSVNISGSLNETGLVTIRGTAATDTATSGSELLSTANWTSGSAWTGDFNTGFTHLIGNTTALTNTLGASTGLIYQAILTVTGRTAGSFSVTFGGTVPLSGATITATSTLYFRASSTGTLSITPTTDFDGTVVISLRVMNASSYLVRLQDSTGATQLEMRAPTSIYNTFIGINAGAYNTVGQWNVAIGNSLFSNVNGSRNIAIGNAALGLNTSVNQSIAIGEQAAYNHIGNFQGAVMGVAIGWSAASALTTGTRIVALGWRAGYLNTTGNYWTSIGDASGYANSVGSNWTALGAGAGTANVSGSNWTALGTNAVYANITGSNFTTIGAESARYYADGVTPATDFSNGVYLGYQTRVGTASTANETVIGYQAIGLGSNTTAIGNSSTTTTWLGGNLLLGSTTASGDRIFVSGSARITNGLTVSGSSLMTGSLIITGAIGTTTPSLAVYGWGNPLVSIGQAGNNTALLVGSSGGSSLSMGWGNGGAYLSTTANTTLFLQSGYNSPSNLGAVAIGYSLGVSIPQGRFSIKGYTSGSNLLTASFWVGDVNASASFAVFDDRSTVAYNGLQVTGSLNAPSITGSLFGTASWALNALTASSVSSTAIVGDLSRIATGSVTASVGVGTGSFQLVSGSSTFLFVSSSGNVGIGTSTPSGKFHTYIDSNTELIFQNSSQNNLYVKGINSSLVLDAAASNYPGVFIKVAGALCSNFSGTTTSTNIVSYNLSPIIFQHSSVERARFSAAGNFLIGTTTDAGFKLDVSGSARVSSQLYVQSASLDYQQNLSLQTGSWQTIVASPTGSYKAAFFDYVMFSGSIGRAGTVTTFWSASATEFYENYTEDLGGSTTGVVLQTAISASQIALQATASSAAWTIRSLVRLL